MAVVFALVAVLVGLVGNVIVDPHRITIFISFFALIGALVAIMFLRISILRFGLFVLNTATAAVLIPVAITIAQQVPRPEDARKALTVLILAIEGAIDASS